MRTCTCGAVVASFLSLALTPNSPPPPRPHAPTKQPRQPFLSQSAVRQSANGGRLISQFQCRNACQPARVIPHVDCAMLSQFYVYYRLCIVGAMFKLRLYNITVLNSQFLSCWQSMAYGWTPNSAS